MSEQSRLSYLFQEASKLKMQERHSQAFDLLRHCQAIDNEAPEVLYELALYELYFRQDSVALGLLRRAIAFDPLNTFYKEHWPHTILTAIKQNRPYPTWKTLSLCDLRAAIF